MMILLTEFQDKEMIISRDIMCLMITGGERTCGQKASYRHFEVRKSLILQRPFRAISPEMREVVPGSYTHFTQGVERGQHSHSLLRSHNVTIPKLRDLAKDRTHSWRLDPLTAFLAAFCSKNGRTISPPLCWFSSRASNDDCSPSRCQWNTTSTKHVEVGQVKTEDGAVPNDIRSRDA